MRFHVKKQKALKSALFLSFLENFEKCSVADLSAHPWSVFNLNFELCGQNFGQPNDQHYREGEFESTKERSKGLDSKGRNEKEKVASKR